MVQQHFITSGVIVDETKFSFVTGMLELRFALEVIDTNANAPQNSAYNKLETALLKRLGSTQEQKNRRFVEEEDIGDRTASQFLRHLESLAETSLQKRFLWLRCLPTAMLSNSIG